MKILFVHTRYKFKGGEDTVFMNDVQLMKAHGYEVDTMLFNNHRFAFLKLLLLPFNFISYLKLSRKLTSFKPDLVHIHNIHFAASPAVIRAVHNKSIPCVVTLHNFRLICPSGTLSHKNKLYMWSLGSTFPWRAVRDGVYKNSIILSFWLSLSNWLHQQFKTWQMVDRYIVPNAYASELFLAHNNLLFRNRLIVKPNHYQKSRPRSTERTGSFLFAGRLSEEKGLNVLLEAQAILGFKLTIIGEGPLLPRLVNHASTNSNITYLGPLDNAYVMEQLSRCNALILPSVCMEMNPMVMVEAMACGTPVIASNLGTLAQFISDGENGLLFEVNNSLSLCHAVKRFTSMDIGQKTLLNEQARRSYEEHFTPGRSFDTVDYLYNILVYNGDGRTQIQSPC